MVLGVLALLTLSISCTETCSAQEKSENYGGIVRFYQKDENDKSLYLSHVEPVDRDDVNSNIVMFFYVANGDKLVFIQYEKDGISEVCRNGMDYWNLQESATYKRSIYNNVLYLFQNYNGQTYSVIRKMNLTDCTEIDHKEMTITANYTTGHVFEDSSGQVKMIACFLSPSGNLAFNIFDDTFTLLHAYETNHAYQDGQHVFISSDTSTKSSEWCEQTSDPCAKDNFIISFYGGSQGQAFKMSVDSLTIYWRAVFHSGEGDLVTNTVDPEENTVYFLNTHRSNNFVYFTKANNTDVSKLWAFRIANFENGFAQSYVDFYSDYVLIISPVSEIKFFTKETGELVKSQTVEVAASIATLSPFELSFGIVVGELFFGSGTYTVTGGYKKPVFFRMTMPYLNDLGNSNFVVISSTSTSYTISDNPYTYSISTAVSLYTYSNTFGTRGFTTDDLNISEISANSVSADYLISHKALVLFILVNTIHTASIPTQICKTNSAFQDIKYALPDENYDFSQSGYDWVTLSQNGTLTLSPNSTGHYEPIYYAYYTSGVNDIEVMMNNISVTVKECNISNCATCEIDSSNGALSCQTCEQNNQVYVEEENACVTVELSTVAESSIYAVQGIVALQGIVSIGSSLLGQEPNTQSIWKIVNFLQNLMVLVCLQVSIPPKFITTIQGFEAFAFNFSDIIPFLKDYLDLLAKWFETENTVLPQFNDIGFGFFSIFINYHCMFLLSFCFIFLHLGSTFVYNHTDKRLLNTTEKVIVHFYESMTFGFYIRLVFFEMILFMLLNAVIEVISLKDKISDGQPAGAWIISYSLAIVTIPFYLALFAFQTWHWWKKMRVLKEKSGVNNDCSSEPSNEMIAMRTRNHDKFSSFYDSLRTPSNFSCKTYLIQAFHTIFIFRRLIFIAIVTSFIPCSSQTCAYAQVGTLAFSQVIFMVYICCIHSFEKRENNIVEIYNESIFCVLIGITMTLPHSESTSSGPLFSYELKETLMCSIVSFCSLFLAVMNLIATGVKLCTKCCKAKKPTQTQPKQRVRLEMQRVKFGFATEEVKGSDIDHSAVNLRHKKL